MRKCIITFWLVLTLGFSNILSAQESQLIPPKAITSSFLPIDSLHQYTFLDTLPSPTTYLLWDAAADQYFIGRPQAEGFQLIAIEGEGYPMDATWREINGTGTPELLVHLSDRYGRSGWESGHASSVATLDIYDLDAPALLLSFTYCMVQENWWTQYAEPAHDSIPYEDREVLDTGGEYWEECYTITWEKEVVKFMPKVSELYEPEEPLPSQIFRWTAEGFVQQ